MAKILVFLNGTKITERDLDPSRDYVIGRASTCDIVLDNNELSRQHAKISLVDQVWTCRVLSKYGSLVVNGVGVESLNLVDGGQFHIPPFEIKFQEEQGVSSETTKEFKENIDEKTHTGFANLKAVFLRLNESGQPIEEITLGEGLIEAGRSRSCQIRLKDKKASRKHFKMENDGRVITLTDLGSPNRTYVNGSPVTLHTLVAGDEIKIGTETFRFEYLNSAFENLPAAEVVSDATQPAVIKFSPDQVPALWNQPQNR